MKLPKPIALWLALRKCTDAEAKKVRRSIGQRYAKRRKA